MYFPFRQGLVNSLTLWNSLDGPQINHVDGILAKSLFLANVSK